MKPDFIIDDLGGTSAVAKICKVKPPSVTEWRTRGIPKDKAPALEKASGGKHAVEKICKGVRWIRVKDKSWPHPDGRPLLDHTV